MPNLPARSAIAIGLSVVFLTGCAIAPNAISLSEQREMLEQDKKVVLSAVEPVGSMLTMNEAVARGLKYNMEHRQRMLEEAVALGVADLSNFDMLPRLLANAGYTYRNNDFRTKQLNLSTNTLNDSGVISSEREYSTSGLSLQWSALDFGISYYTARQNADRLLISAERRRRTMHVLVQDIQSAYVRAAAASKLRGEIARIMEQAEISLQNSRKVEAEGLRPLLDTLRFQKSILDNMRLLETIDQELSSARVELNRLINLPPASSFGFEDPSQMTVPPSYAKVDTRELEARALAFNAELKQGIYEARIAAEETRKALLRYFPNLTFNYGPQYSDNSFYINKNWTEGAAQLSFNLFNLISAPAANRRAQAEKELAEQRRMMVQMAVVSQVHLAKLQLQGATDLYQLSSEIDKVDSRLVKIVIDREQKGAASQAERVAAETSAVVSKLRKYQALAALFGASGRLQATIGVEPQFDSLADTPLAKLTQSVKASADTWNTGRLPSVLTGFATGMPSLKPFAATGAPPASASGASPQDVQSKEIPQEPKR